MTRRTNAVRFRVRRPTTPRVQIGPDKTADLDAAAHVLSAKGYAGLRLNDVAAHAELQAPAIYYYYPSRDDLIEEVMWAGIADMRDMSSQCWTAYLPAPLR